MKSFGDGFVVNVHMRNRSSDIVLDASIHDNKSMGGVTQRLDSYIIKLLNSGFKVVFIVFAKRMK